ncbi:MAG TPA: phosphodiester glycosidase family protein [Gemmatimonadaceae bacterium]|nr:phosphodiester glycosidase family protein [Gemmatimonadaceae bacterium]
MRLFAHAALALMLLPCSVRAQLAVRVAGEWHEWWTPEAAPARWRDATPLARRVAWRRAADGVEWGELLLRGRAEAWRTRLVVARLDPARLRFSLDTAFSDGRASWRIDVAPSDAVFAANAGQFVHTMPWGWVVLDGRPYLLPGRGPLVTTVLVDSLGTVRWRHGAPPDVASTRHVQWAFQSYPTLLAEGMVPPALRAGAGTAIDLAHRDARLALGALADGRLVVAMTRFDALGERFGAVPFGLTVPETAAVMGALGARDAVLLDGGISAQMLVREKGATRRWPGLRPVPLGLIARPIPAVVAR